MHVNYQRKVYLAKFGFQGEKFTYINLQLKNALTKAMTRFKDFFETITIEIKYLLKITNKMQSCQ